MSASPSDQLWKIRHSSEHLLTMAMEELFGTTQVVMAMGPATETGFYFDFEPRAGFTISEAEFAQIESRIKQLIKKNMVFVRQEISPELARQVFADNPYKQEWIQEAADRGENLTIYLTGRSADIPAAQELVEQGSRPNLSELRVFVDLCKGPHVENTREIGAVKLLSVAGAYWRGDEKNQMLTRVYGTAFASQEEMDEYLHFLEEAKRRDHRRLGKDLDLFTFSELVGPGLPLWTPKGTLLRTILDEFVWKLRHQYGYQKVEIPHVTKKDLYETSGHWDKFKDELFRIQTREGHEFAMKPMNCPHHTQIFDRRPHSYREMPQRYANTTMVYRDEQTGELAGLTRVRSITQDDAHVFCRPSQVKDEMNKIWNIIETFYGAMGFDLRIRLSLHDPEHPEKYLGTPEQWQKSEQEIRELAQSRVGDNFVEAPGEAAFYGPKVDFMGHDSLGREWQVATIQLDTNMPSRFDLNCINEQGESERVVMIHAAIMGSIERFLATLIEHFAGAFPVWLAPIQAAIIPISQAQSEYAAQVADQLRAAGLRVEVRDEAETMQNRIRKAELEKIPYMIVLGEREKESGSISVRTKNDQSTEKNAILSNSPSVDELIAAIQAQTPEVLRVR